MECKILYLDSIVHATRFKQRKVYAKYREKKNANVINLKVLIIIFFFYYLCVFSFWEQLFFSLQTHVIIAVCTDPNYVLISYVFWKFDFRRTL